MRKALVTGASRGIGYTITKKLLQNDFAVVITGRNISNLECVARELGKNVFPMFWNAMEFDKAEEKINNLAIYLLSDNAKMICGETVIFDGGYSIR